MKKFTSVLSGCLLLFFATTITLTSCKKDKGDDNPNPPANNQLSDADSLKLLMYNIMEKSFVDNGRDKTYNLPLYYWYSDVKGVDPLSAAYPDANALLEKMKSFAVQPNGIPYDRYSFLDNGQGNSEIFQGVAGDIGMQVTYAYDANNNIVLVVLYADRNSPAGQSGVQRGWQITAINNQSVSYDGPNGANVNRVINAVFYDAQASFTFKKPDASTTTISLSKTQYQINPVLFDSVYTISGKKVGYFVFYTFPSTIDNNGAATLTQQELTRVFNKFQSQNISSLIVDFRYNGGGAGVTAEFLTSQIAPSTATGKVMYQILYNDKLTPVASQINLDQKILFTNGGNLNLQNVFFITNDQTASASELVINNLKPYVNVQVVGDTTSGKPFGFIMRHITIFKNGVEKDLADLYAITDEVRNANNEGKYYNGIFPDKSATDYIGLPWGNPNDENLERIFNFIGTGSYGRVMPQSERLSRNKNLSVPIKTELHPLRFEGLINERASRSVQKMLNR